ncbi:MAG: hypothetical protein ACLFR8_05035 [Alkalispirochaeta sp.]
MTILLPGSSGSFREPHDPALGDDRCVRGRVYRLPEGRIVRRARGPYLYDQHGDRYLDLWGADGTAFLGHRPRGYSRLAKEEIDRGLWSPFPTSWPYRFRRAVTELVRVHTGTRSLRDVPVWVLNGAVTGGHGVSATRWLPTAPFPRSDKTPAGIVLPAPGVSVAGYRTVEEIPAIILALLTRSAHLLGQYLSSEECRLRCDLAMEMAVPPGYTRHGAWLVPDDPSRNEGVPGGATAPADVATATSDDWRRLRERALAYRIVLPPDGATPIAIPGGIGRFDVTQWKRLCDEWPL